MSRRLIGGGNMTRLHIILDFFELKTELESLKGSRDDNEKNMINKRFCRRRCLGRLKKTI